VIDKFQNETFINSLIRTGALEPPVTSLYHERSLSTTPQYPSNLTAPIPGSQLCLGCYDSSKFTGDFAFIQQRRTSGGWVGLLDGILVGDYVVNGTKDVEVRVPRLAALISQAFFDSGYALAPTLSSILAAVAQTLSDSSSRFPLVRSPELDALFGNGQYYAMDCSAVLGLPAVSLQFAGKRFVIDKRDMFVPIGDGRCALSWFGTDTRYNDASLVLGATQIKNLYVRVRMDGLHVASGFKHC